MTAVCMPSTPSRGQAVSFLSGGEVFSSPALAARVIYVGSDTGNLYALNAANVAKRGPSPHPATCTRRRRWPTGWSTSAPRTGRVYALNATTGTKLWSDDTCD